jgi:DnaJ-class molecular chaperone
VAHDFSPDELRKAYRAASLHYHPDKRATGSSGAFARVAAAHAALSDPDQRRAFDTGNASPEAVKDGLGPFLWDEVEELYFPEAVKRESIWRSALAVVFPRFFAVVNRFIFSFHRFARRRCRFGRLATPLRRTRR